MSETGGKATYKGINAQSWAALSLFLQKVSSSDLEHIAFEQDKLKDFDLVFSSGKKIVCESKTSKVTHGVLKKILVALVGNKKIGKQDEILVVCQEISDELESDIENIKYFDRIKDKFIEKGYTNSQMKLLSKVKFWKVSQDTNVLIVKTLLSEILVTWFPDKILDEIISDILIDKVYRGSEKSKTFTRKEFYEMLERRKKQVQDDAGYKNKQQEKLEWIDRILDAIKDPDSREWCNNQITLLSTMPDLYYLTIKKLESIPDLKLAPWDNLWRAFTKGAFSLNVFNIFLKNVDDEENQDYLIEFLPSVISDFMSFYRQEFMVVDIVKICSSIVSKTRKHDVQIFDVLKKLIELNNKEVLYSEKKGGHGRGEWEEEQIVEALEKLYKETNKTIKSNIIKLIFSYYDLVDDSGEYWHHTPNSIFNIIRDYVEADVEKRVIEFSNEISNQYSKFYERYGKKVKFKGWEYMGFADTDRHFITLVLRPVLEQYFASQPELAWKFIKEKMVTLKESEISKENPDFLNRAVISILLKAYQNDFYEKEALGILKKFVEMKKGIPHKTELIYHQLADSSMSESKKWELVRLQLDYEPYGKLPVNKHVEKIVSELANDGHVGALDTLEAWSVNPEFNKFKGVDEGNISKNISGLLSNPKTQKRGILMLHKFISSDLFFDKQGLWDVWETARTLSLVLVKDFHSGREIIQEIWANDKLTKNQQVLITSSINDLDKNDEILIRSFDEMISSWFDDVEDNLDKFIDKVPDVQSRLSIVQIGEKLAKAKRYDAAVRIAKIFIDDPDPTLENDPDDPEGKSNYHELVKKGEDVSHITTVRASVAWLLQSVAVLNGRDYIPQILPLVKKLSTDENYYVRAYSCVPLEQLMSVRHTVLPDNQTERFLSTETASEIESISYDMLHNKENWKLTQVMRGILRMFYNMRSITTEEAKEILNTFIKTKNYEVIEEARSLFIFFAEFRVTAVNQAKLSHVYSKDRLEELKKFDDKYFRDLLVKILTDYPSEVKGGFAWAFWHLPKEKGVDFDECFAIAYKYLYVLAKNYEHEVMKNIYYFISDNYEDRFEECFSLWTQCLTVERPYLRENITKDNLYEMHWWPFHYNGKILVKICEEKGETEFLKWLDYLIEYPEGATIANDINLVVEKLVTLNVTDVSKSVFQKLAVRFPEYYERMKTWIENA